MTVLLWTVAAACVLPYLASSAQLVEKFRQHGRYDNTAPRAQTARLEGAGQRAAWAQANTWEALPPFFAAALTVHITGADGNTAGMIGVVFVAARAAYIAVYLANLATLRSAMWTVGVACVAGLFALAAMH